MKVLFVGNSHTYFNDMPQTFADMCSGGAPLYKENVAAGQGADGYGEDNGVRDGQGEVGDNVDVTMLAYSWKDLEWHVSTEYFAIRFAILYGGYDYCVIQQGAHPFPGDETTLVNAQRIAALCEKAGTQPIIIETWAERDFPEHQENLSRANRMVAEKIGAQLAPVGTVWAKIRAEHPDIDLFWKDGEHAGMYGDLIIAGILCRMVTGREMTPVDYARDFAQDIMIDFHKPQVLEDVAGILTEPDPDIVRVICDYVNSIEILRAKPSD